jgi:RNA polymerase sigma-70 factor (ECF subfamily)
VETPREDILSQVAKGDSKAVSELLDRYGGLVWSLARRLCFEASEIEDAVQDVFVALWQGAHRFDRSLGSEETFVAMVARRRLIDRRRRAQRRQQSIVAADVSLTQSPDCGPLHAERSEQAQRAASILATLRPEQESCLRLSIYQGLSHEQIARATGIPLGTVKTHVRRGLIALRDALQEPSPGSTDAAVAAPVSIPAATAAPRPIGIRP